LEDRGNETTSPSSSNVRRIDPERVRVILATDVGSTTTKAILIKRMENGDYRLVVRGEAPTTVEAPFEDVTLGVKNSVREVEELTGHKILREDGEGIIEPNSDSVGVDLYVSTSSAGGGLQMMVFGVVKVMTAESAERAALGAGAIVMDVVSIDDGRPVHEKIQRIRTLRPDMILLAGGTDGGTITHVVELAELISAAEPRPRLGTTFQLPIVYAGNKDAREHVKKVLGEKFAIKIVDNIRPVLEVENVGPARDAIHELFLEHVMSHAPGYDKLLRWVDAPILPTPGAVGMIIQELAKKYGINVIGTDPGGATTDVFSVFDGRYTKSVSANLGMSYSICNVMKEAGLRNIIRWVPLEVDEADVRNRLRNKMIRPTTIPQTILDLLIEQGVNREGMRLAFEQHKLLARGLRGVQRVRTVSDVFEQETGEETFIDMMRVHIIVGSGGVNAHAPRREQAMLMLIDAFQPEGVTRIAVDSIFMMPHLGVLSTVHPKAALDVFEKDCLIWLGTVISPRGQLKLGEKAMEVKILKGEEEIDLKLNFGELKRIKLGESEEAVIQAKPSKALDLGRGPGREIETKVSGGVAGIVLDARGRPLTLPEDDKLRRKLLLDWFDSIGAYEREVLENYVEPGG